MKTLFILNDAPYGSERSYNGVRLAGSLSKIEGEEVKVFLIGDAAVLRQGRPKGAGGFLQPPGHARPRSAQSAPRSACAEPAWTRAASPTRN